MPGAEIDGFDLDPVQAGGIQFTLKQGDEEGHGGEGFRVQGSGF